MEELQDELRQRVITSDVSSETTTVIQRIGGIDISFMKDTDNAVTCLVVMDVTTKEIVHVSFERVVLDLPYMPGFLAFREAPHMQRLIQRLRKTNPELMPDVLLVDGNGIFHPRGCGLASHLGVLENMMTIGVSKTLAFVDGIGRDTKIEKPNDSDFSLLRGTSGTVHGAAFYAHAGIKNPVYVSIGHKLSLDRALHICRSCCEKYRIPEPVRQADIRSREQVRLWQAELNS